MLKLETDMLNMVFEVNKAFSACNYFIQNLASLRNPPSSSLSRSQIPLASVPKEGTLVKPLQIEYKNILVLTVVPFIPNLVS